MVRPLLELDPSGVAFNYNEYGQPSTQASNSSHDFYFNISHSQTMAAFSFYRKRVGIDIEFKKNIKNLNAMLRHICHPDELREFDKLGEQETYEAFFTLWTRKESFIKANGQGLSMGLRSIYIGIRPDKAITQVRHKDIQLNDWFIQDLQCPNEYKMAITVEQ